MLVVENCVLHSEATAWCNKSITLGDICTLRSGQWWHCSCFHCSVWPCGYIFWYLCHFSQNGSAKILKSWNIVRFRGFHKLHKLHRRQKGLWKRSQFIEFLLCLSCFTWCRHNEIQPQRKNTSRQIGLIQIKVKIQNYLHSLLWQQGDNCSNSIKCIEQWVFAM